MRLLHLSDIHFKEPDCLTPRTDPERPYRTRLQEDLVGLCGAKPVDAILVTGDIAFKGHPSEYEAAEEWLKGLAAACGCRPERIYVVPGNHDVDRGVCARSKVIAGAQKAIADAPPLEREREFRAQLRDEETGPALFRPLAAYNSFAAPFGCFIRPDQPFWVHDLDDLGGGVTLRLHGLTTTLISGLGGRDDRAGGLYLSPLQTVLDPLPDVLNLVMAHHPPRWLMDETDVDDAVNDRAPLQFFGHEHRQRCVPTDGYVRFSAGAVNPERHEHDWKPGYNVIDIDVVGAGPSRVVRVKAHVRQLQRSPERFVALVNKHGQDVWVQDILFPRLATHVALPAQALRSGETSLELDAPAAAGPLVALHPEVTMSSPITKGLVYRFWNLPDSQKRDLMLRLNLISPTEPGLSDDEMYDRGLRLAASQGRLEELAVEVSALEQQG